MLHCTHPPARLHRPQLRIMREFFTLCMSITGAQVVLGVTITSPSGFGAAEVRVGAVRAPSGVPPAWRLHPAQHAAGHGAQRAHARVVGPIPANLDAVDAALAEPFALGHLREPVAGEVHLNVAAVAHDDAVVLDVPEIRVRLAADVA